MGGHLGEEKTLGRLKERFYWPGHFTDVRNWCKTCAACATRKTPPTRGRAPLKNIEVGQMVAMDILGPLHESDSGNSYLLVASDYFTRWVEVYAIPNQEAQTVAKKLVDEMFCRFSPPEQLHSDQGRQSSSNTSAISCKSRKPGQHLTTLRVMALLKGSTGPFSTCSQPRPRVTLFTGRTMFGRYLSPTTPASTLPLVTLLFTSCLVDKPDFLWV